MKKFSIVCDDMKEFTECQKLLFKLGYGWNVINDEDEDEKTELYKKGIIGDSKIAILINYAGLTDGSFIYDNKYKEELNTDHFYRENPVFKYKQFARKYKLEKIKL